MITCLFLGIAAAQTRTTPVGPDGKPAPFKKDPAVRSIVRKAPARTNQPSAVDTAQAKPLIPRQVKASPATYLGRELRVAGQPTLKLDPATGKWTGTSDGMAVEASAEAYILPAHEAKGTAPNGTGLRPIPHVEIPAKSAFRVPKGGLIPCHSTLTPFSH